MKEKNWHKIKMITIVLLILYSATLISFALQYIYNEGITINVNEEYGVYNNGVLKETGEVLVPSPYSVKILKIVVQNNINKTKSLNVSFEIEGKIEYLSENLREEGGKIVAEINLPPYGSEEMMVVGKNITLANPIIEYQSSEIEVENKELVLVDERNNKTEKYRIFSYVREQKTPEEIYDSTKKIINIGKKSWLIMISGIAILTITSWLAMQSSRKRHIISKEEKRRPQIHIRKLS